MIETHEFARADATRARLLEAATIAFAAKGFHGTTTRDIAAAAGMSPAALYVHHKSKEELLHLIVRGAAEDTLRMVQGAIESSPDSVSAMRRVIHDFATSHATLNTRARVLNYEIAALTPEHQAEVRNLSRRIETEIRELVERGVAEGVFDTPDPRLAAVALCSLGVDVARWYHDGARWTPEQVADRYAEIGLRIVGAS